MPTRSIAPRLRLLGLLLICASIMMGLLLSAAGVSSVNLSSPFGKEMARKVDQVSELGRQSGSYSPFGANNTSLGNSHIEPLMQNPYDSNNGYNSPFSTSSYTRGQQESSISEQANAPKLASEDDTHARKIPLWYLITPICVLGIFLWMTPMPAPSSSRRVRRR